MRKINTLVLLAMLMTSTLLTAQIYVSDLAVGGNNDGTTWVDAYLDLQSAIASATEGDEIWIALGEYYPPAVLIDDLEDIDTTYSFVINKNLKIYGGFIGGETSIEQRNPTFNPVILNGDINDDDLINQFDVNKSDNARHILYLTENVTNETIIDGLFLWRGYANSNQQAASSFGAGIYSAGNPIIRNCTVNECYAKFGGGIYLESVFPGSVIIEQCDIDRNGALEMGSGIFGQYITNLSIKDTKISRSKSDGVGTVYLIGIDSVELTDCNIRDNEAATASAFYSKDVMNIVFNQSNIENNSSRDSFTILIENEDPASATILVQTKILNNVTNELNAGIYNGVGALSFTNCLVAGNATANDAIAVSSDGHVVFNHTTLSGLRTPLLEVTSTVETSNSIFHNVADGLFTGGATITSTGGNICSDNSMDAGLTASGDLTVTNPFFTSIVDGNYIPSFGSPCIDASVNSTVTVDIDGNPRVDLPDIGAYEYVLSATSQSEIPGINISLVPNLVVENLHVQWKGQDFHKLNYQIVNQNGQQVQTGIIHSNNQILNVADFSNGQYHMLFTSTDGSTTSRSFIKIK